MATCSKRHVPEEDLAKDDLKKSRVEDSKVERADGQVVEGAEQQVSISDQAKTEDEGEAAEEIKEFIIGKKVCECFFSGVGCCFLQLMLRHVNGSVCRNQVRKDFRNLCFEI